MKKLTVLFGLVMALALALPGSADAAALTEVKKLTASDAQAGVEFGRSTAVSGDTAIVGAGFEGAGGSDAGAAYIFERNQGGPDNWGEVKKLTASDAQAGNRFGVAVAISGDTVIVGARAGAAYIFERNQGGPGNWGEVKKLTAQVGIGGHVAVSGDVVLVGAQQEASFAGAAYIFERDEGGPGNWGEVKKLTASDAQAFDQFGGALFEGNGVAISGGSAVVGAFVEDAGGINAGAAYVFERNQGGPDNWGEVKKLTASDAQAFDLFGNSVAISGDSAVVGANNAAAGAAYIFERNQGGAGNWGEVKKLTASDAQPLGQFGRSVAISGGSAIVGTSEESSVGLAAGAAYQFKRDQGGAGNWGEVVKLTASDAQALDKFSWSVAASGEFVIVGAPGEDAGGSDAGAAYVFGPLTPETAPDEQININVVDRLSGGKLEGTCWRISYSAFKVPHDVVGDDVAGVKPDCGEPSNVKLFDEEPSAGNLRITITSAQRIQFGNIWHAQMSFSPIGGLDTFNYECDLSLGKCTIGPVAVGGLVVDLDEGPLALDTTGSSGGSAGVLAGTVAGIAALAVTLTGAAWYARRRL